MQFSEYAEAIRKILKRQMSACEQALRREDIQTAKRELDDAANRLKKLAREMEYEPDV